MEAEMDQKYLFHDAAVAVVLQVSQRNCCGTPATATHLRKSVLEDPDPHLRIKDLGVETWSILAKVWGKD
jgi:hypothetical protein